jgi:hypothetical protein
MATAFSLAAEGAKNLAEVTELVTSSMTTDARLDDNCDSTGKAKVGEQFLSVMLEAMPEASAMEPPLDGGSSLGLLIGSQAKGLTGLYSLHKVR